MALYLLDKNGAQTTIPGTLTAGATSITVTSGATFDTPGAGQQFVARIDGNPVGADAGKFEYVLVTTNAANVFTATRGQEGTSGQAFTVAGATITQVLTQAAFNAYVARGDYMSTYQAFVYQSANQTINAAVSDTTLALDTVIKDPNANFNVATHQYTVPVTGSYLVSWAVEFAVSSNPDQWWTGIYVAGTLKAQGPQLTIRGATANDPFGTSASVILALTAAQLVDLRLHHTAGGNPATVNGNAQPATWLSIAYFSA